MTNLGEDSGALAGARVLVVDDQRNMRRELALMLSYHGADCHEAHDGADACDLIARDSFDLIVTDLKMGVVDGLDVVRHTKEVSPLTEVIVMTAYGTIESAIEAIQRGAHAYIQKPFTEQELLLTATKALEVRRLATEVQVLAAQFRERYGFDRIAGRSAAIREALGRIVRIAPTDATVLLVGESGTGKELVARAIHANSKRAARPFVVVNCNAIGDTWLESEVFGHVRGAFAGALGGRRGLCEEAHGGTLFFDEVAETSASFQAKLLKVIREGEIRRLGDERTIHVDVRVVAATSRDLQAEVRERRFRQDLYYRLNVARFALPPLRERREDIPLLVEHFLANIEARTGARISLAQDILDDLIARDYPGNVSELEALIEQGALFARSGVIDSTVIRSPARSPESSTVADPARPAVFLCYARADSAWLDRVQVHLKPLERWGLVERWDDTRINTGDDWRTEIEVALKKARVAVLLVSPDFLASDFIARNELPELLQAAEQHGLRVVNVILRPCLFDEHTELSRFQATNDPRRPLAAMELHEQDAVLVATARSILRFIQSEEAR